jgi:bifunctional UDP-N-acetylglucosamine pyrophosphorylase/glucosamine-1-phosphate N-acetyltransferase
MGKLTALILAAGESTRMRSSRPKVLHHLCGRPLIDYPVGAARALGARVVVVVGRGADLVRTAVGKDGDATFVEQTERLGTGHAVLAAQGVCADESGVILVLPGDMPLLSKPPCAASSSTIRETKAAVTVLTAELADPTGYGRVVRESSGPWDRRASRCHPAQRAIREVGTSSLLRLAPLWPPSPAWRRETSKASTTSPTWSAS